MDDITPEFLIESNENLASLDQQIVQLEQNPSDAGLLASIFRTMHTIKGTSGMLGFSAVEGVAHLAESLLSQVRGGTRSHACLNLADPEGGRCYQNRIGVDRGSRQGKRRFT